MGKDEDWRKKIKIKYNTGVLQLILAKLKSVYEHLGHGAALYFRISKVLEGLPNLLRSLVT